LILLGAWGALVPLVGPYFDFAFRPDSPWLLTGARGWLEVLPGAAAAVGGLLLFVSRNRATAMLGGWLTIVSGGWLVVGRAFAGLLRVGDVGVPVAAHDTKRIWLELTYFYGLGALIVLLGALAVGRLSVRTLRDIEYGRRPLPVPDHVVEPPTERIATAANLQSPQTDEAPRRVRGGLVGRHRAAVPH
jgi:hypothetical protein